MPQPGLTSVFSGVRQFKTFGRLNYISNVDLRILTTGDWIQQKHLKFLFLFLICWLALVSEASAQHGRKARSLKRDTCIRNCDSCNVRYTHLSIGMSLVFDFAFYTNQLNKIFYPNAPFGISILFGLDRFVAIGTISYGSGFIRDSLLVSGIWYRHRDKYFRSKVSFTVGYFVPLNCRYSLYPYAGISGQSISLSPSDKNLKRFGGNTSPVIGMSLNYEFERDPILRRKEGRFSNFNFKYEFIPTVVSTVSGSCHNLIFSMTFGGPFYQKRKF